MIGMILIGVILNWLMLLWFTKASAKPMIVTQATPTKLTTK
jgi:hypothetical protein